MLNNLIASRTIGEGMIEVTLACSSCTQPVTLTMTIPQFGRVTAKHRELIQTIFPEMPPPDRELFVSGICRNCWKQIFGAEDTSAESNPQDDAPAPFTLGAVLQHQRGRRPHSHPRRESRPPGTLPATQQVKAVQQYLETCGMPREAFVVAWDGGDYSGVVARVEGYFGKFTGIETTVRDAMQNMASDNFSLCPSRRTSGTAVNPLLTISDERVAELEAEGMTHSDAIGVAMAEQMGGK